MLDSGQNLAELRSERKKEMKLVVLALLSVLVVSNAFGDSKRIALEGQVATLGLTSISAYNYTTVDPGVLVGIRYCLSDTFGVDLSVGFTFSNSIKPDLA